ALDLGGHGVQASAGVCLNVLDGLLKAGHGGVEFVDGVGRLFDEGFLDSMVLGQLGLDIFLALKQRGDIALELDDFTGYGESRARTDEAARYSAEEHGATEEH